MGAAALDFHPATTAISTKTPSDPSLGLHPPRPGSQAPLVAFSVRLGQSEQRPKKKKKKNASRAIKSYTGITLDFWIFQGSELFTQLLPVSS